MTPSDLKAVIAIHQSAFPGFFLTRMGHRFLREYYQAVLDYEPSIALVACEAETDCPLGFAVGFRNPQGFYALFSQRKRLLVPAVLIAILRDPSLLPAILRNAKRVGAQAQEPVDSVELSSIAVASIGQGLGHRLLEAFANAAQQTGSHHMYLTTDEANNAAVRQFYEVRGFTLDRVEVRGDRRLSRYTRELG